MCLLHKLPQVAPLYFVPASDCTPFLPMCQAVTPQASMATIVRLHHKAFRPASEIGANAPVEVSCLKLGLVTSRLGA